MMVPIDIHTHILPQMDDGSRNPEESIQMLREESRQGIRKVALTPHFYASQNSPAEFLERREESWRLLEPHLEEGMPKLILGAEVQYFEGISRVEDIGTLCLENTGLLLLEMPFSRWSERVIQEMLSLNDNREFRVVLAHVDRYFSTQPKSIWEHLAEAGVLMQLNAEAFLHFGTRSHAKNLLRRGMVQFLGSDCHNMTSRQPNLFKAEAVITKYADVFLEV